MKVTETECLCDICASNASVKSGVSVKIYSESCDQHNAVNNLDGFDSYKINKYYDIVNTYKYEESKIDLCEEHLFLVNLGYILMKPVSKSPKDPRPKYILKKPLILNPNMVKGVRVFESWKERLGQNTFVEY